MEIRRGPHNDLTDVTGLRVGHATRDDSGWLTGTTVVLPETSGAVAGVDVRGAAPGTRETDLLDPGNLVDRVHAIVLTGGSAFGLAAVDGVMTELYAAGSGWPMGAPGWVVPIVPAAVLFDLGRGGEFGHHPGPDEGRAAVRAASDAPVEQGCVGAGTGARAGGLKGGIGSASAVLPDGTTVAALVAVNAVGSPVDLATGELYAARFGLDDEFAEAGRPSAEELTAHREARAGEMAAWAAMTTGGPAGRATTIGVIATDATLTTAQCRKLAGLGHDGIARAVNPAHTMLDGDTLFALATGGREGPVTLPVLFALMAAAADCVTRAIGHAMLGATTAGGMTSLREAFGTAYPAH